MMTATGRFPRKDSRSVKRAPPATKLHQNVSGPTMRDTMYAAIQQRMPEHRRANPSFCSLLQSGFCGGCKIPTSAPKNPITEPQTISGRNSKRAGMANSRTAAQVRLDVPLACLSRKTVTECLPLGTADTRKWGVFPDLHSSALICGVLSLFSRAFVVDLRGRPSVTGRPHTGWRARSRRGWCCWSS